MTTKTTGGRASVVSLNQLNQDGFTLIEVLIAIGIFAIGMLAVAAMQLQATSANTTARISTELTAFGADQMERLTRNSFDDLPSGADVTLSVAEINNLTGLNLNAGGTTADGRFNVSCTVDEDDIVEDTKTVTLSVTELRRGNNHSLTLQHIVPRM